MSKPSLTVEEALEKIHDGISLDDYEVDLSTEIDAVKAFHLRKNGVIVPDELITYHDDDLEYDEDFDEGRWVRLANRVDENKTVNVNLEVNEAISSWIIEKNINVNALLGELLKSFYQAEQLIEKKK